ncbi:paraquat-inducible protein A [Enterovibrio norvegicus FF-162]|uniref:paraquat-inducible protein A n=1 Tax=Enterovibrio norvegicus TaxID=188144 RepID=UPI0002F5DFD9|nr:paraquat-inducible protein A [Enterovibrio norvegicus]OEE89789.1 paraquat-inducible protein A [Enterovibrio norvegicus FF-162]
MAVRDSALISCRECGLVCAIPHLEHGQGAACPRCGHTLLTHVKNTHTNVLAYGLSCGIMLALSCFFPFMSIRVQGLSNDIVLLNALSVFHYFDNDVLAAMLIFTVVVLPVLTITAMMYLFFKASRVFSSSLPDGSVTRSNANRWTQFLCRFILRVEPWLLVDIFFVGVLVSIVKIAAMTDVSLGPAFWTFFLYAHLVLKCSRVADKQWLWDRLFPTQSYAHVHAGDTHLSQTHLVCRLCSQINPTHASSQHDPKTCQRCGSGLQAFNPSNILTTSAALVTTAIILYIPANLYPMMYTTSFGSSAASTIMDGVILIWQLGSYPIALIILTASIIVPITKMLILVHLLIKAKSSRKQSARDALIRLKQYRFIEIIGRWSMIDIFVVAILTALVQFHQLMSITPGPAVFYFALVVVFTLLATHTFDPRVLWQTEAVSADDNCAVSPAPASGQQTPIKQEKHG